MVLGQASINLKLREFSSSFLSRPLHSCLDFVLFFFPFLFCIPILIFAYHTSRSQIFSISFKNSLSVFFSLFPQDCSKLLRLSSKFLISCNTVFLRNFENASRRRFLRRVLSIRHRDASKRRPRGWSDGAAASQNPSPWIQMLSGATVLAPFLLLLFLFLFFGSAHAAASARGCWLSRSTEVASNRTPAQQAIVRSKEIALQKYTESAACKKSKKACLRGVCVDRSRLHFTVTDGKRTRRRRTSRSLRWRKRGWRRLSPVDPRCIEIQREETYPP